MNETYFPNYYENYNRNQKIRKAHVMGEIDTFLVTRRI